MFIGGLEAELQAISWVENELVRSIVLCVQGP